MPLRRAYDTTHGRQTPPAETAAVGAATAAPKSTEEEEGRTEKAAEISGRNKPGNIP